MIKNFKKSCVVYTVLLLVLAGSLCAGAKPNYNYKVYTPAPYVQTKAVTNSAADVIELVVDYSGSMTKWVRLTESLMHDILPQIPSKTRIGFRAFGYIVPLSASDFTAISSKYPGTLISHKSFVNSISTCKTTSQIVKIQPNNKNAMLAGMKLVADGGDTPLTHSLEQTVYKDFLGMDIKTKKKIVLITDGAETCFRNPCNFVKKLVSTRNDVQIDVILIGNNTKLKCLSDSTGGTFRTINSDSGFNNALNSSFGTAAKPLPDNSKPQYEFME